MSSKKTVLRTLKDSQTNVMVEVMFTTAERIAIAATLNSLGKGNKDEVVKVSWEDAKRRRDFRRCIDLEFEPMTLDNIFLHAFEDSGGIVPNMDDAPEGESEQEKKNRMASVIRGQKEAAKKGKFVKTSCLVAEPHLRWLAQKMEVVEIVSELADYHVSAVEAIHYALARLAETDAT